MTNTCRICMEGSKELLSMAVSKRDNEIEILKPGMMFEECLGIEVADIPDCLQICLGCKIHLTYYYDFKQQALRSHDKLMKIRKESEAQLESEAEEILALRFDSSKEQNKQIPETNDHCAIILDGIDEEEAGDIEFESNFNVDIEYLEEGVNPLCVPDMKDETYEAVEENIQNDEIKPVLDTDNYEEVTLKNGEAEILIGKDRLEFNGVQDEEEPDESTDGEKNDKPTSQKNTVWKYHCGICGKKFRNIDIYTGHLNVHQGLPAYCCEICSKEFKYKVNYDYHMKNHNNNRSFKCSFCTKTCLSKWDLKVHMRSHTDGRPYSCEICGRGFRVHSHMTDHMETHNSQRTNECPICCQKYKTRASLKMHLSTVHFRVNEYTCTTCGKVFYRNHHLKVHQKVHQRNSKND